MKPDKRCTDLLTIARSGLTPTRKERFHRLATALLKSLAGKAAKVRSNKAGPAVLGEVTLTAPGMYVSVGSLHYLGVLYRAATDADPYGARSRNRWMPWSALAEDPAGAWGRMVGQAAVDAGGA